MGFDAEIYDERGLPLLTELQLGVKFYSVSAIGGPDRAEISVSAAFPQIWDILGWLNYHIVIRNGNGTVVWDGLIVEATVSRTGLSVGLSLEKMYNKVSVIYNYEDGDGNQQQGTTDWLSDTNSQNLYGVKELSISLSDTTESVAIAKRDTKLASCFAPVPIIALDGDGAGGRLVCAGLWSTNEWFYYENLVGYEAYDVSKDTEHGIGWGFTSNLIGIRNDAIHDLNCRLFKFLRDNWIRVAGSGANNKAFKVSSAPDEKKDVQTTYAPGNDHIYFQYADDILDDLNGLGFCNTDKMIKVSGASAPVNNGYRWVKTEGTNHIEVTPGTLTNSPQGPAITIVQGHALKLENSPPYPPTTGIEYPEAFTATLTQVGTKVGQRFQITSAAAWTVKEVVINCARIGTPNDSLQVGIYSDSANAPGTLLAFSAMDATKISSKIGWVSFMLVAGYTLAVGTKYWIVVERSGSNDPANFWKVGLETETLETDILKVYDVNTWVTRDPDSAMPFQLWAQRDTALQIKDMVSRNPHFTGGVFLSANSGIEERQWRAGDQKTSDEIQKLLDSGTLSGKRLLAKTIPNKGVMIYHEPAPAVDDPIYMPDGSLRSATSDTWEEGVLPAGMWIRLADVPVRGGLSGDLDRVFIRDAEFDVEGNTLRLTPWEMEDDEY